MRRQEQSSEGNWREEVDKACSFLLNGEGSQRKRAGGHEGKREKIKLVRREEEGEVSGSKVTNGRHSAWFCLLNSPVMEAWIRVQIVKETERERERERTEGLLYIFHYVSRPKTTSKSLDREREREMAVSGYSVFCLTSESYASLVDVCGVCVWCVCVCVCARMSTVCCLPSVCSLYNLKLTGL